MGVWLVGLFLLPQAITIRQQSSGWCSPNVAGVENATIICNGISPKVVRRLNRELNQTKLLLSEKLAAANAWAQRYFELLDLVSEVKVHTPAITQAERLIKSGKLDEASNLLGTLIDLQKEGIDQAARLFFLKGQVEDVAFNLEEATNLYSRAEQLSPDTSGYSFAHASALWRSGQKQEARAIYTKAIDRLTKRSPTEDTSVNLVKFRNALGTLLRVMNEFLDAGKQLEQAEQLSEQLRASNATYTPLVADTLTRIGDLFRDLHVFGQAINTYERAIELHRESDAKESEAPTVTRLLTAIGDCYLGLLMFEAAEKRYREAVEKIQEVLPVKLSPLHIELGDVLISLGDIYRTSDTTKAEEAYLRADNIFHQLLRESQVTSTINTANDRLCQLYLSQGQLSKARRYAEAEVRTYRLLFRRQGELYGSDLGRSLVRLAVISKAQDPNGPRHCSLAREAQDLKVDWEIKIGILALGCPAKEP